MYINKAYVFGNLTRDPELRAMPNGGNVASFGIATNRTYKKSDGTRQEDTEYHNIIVFGKTAESCAQYLKKGSSAYIEGRLQTRSWDKDGQKQYKTEIVAEAVQFGPRPQAAPGRDIAPESDPNQLPPSERAEDEQPAANPAGSSGIEYPQEDINPDDIPF
jgi:single-strand DNA-binding protein